MAALVDFNDYKKRLSAPRDTIQTSKTASSLTTARLYDNWLRTYTPGVAPTAPVVPTNATAGALGQVDAAAEDLYCLGAHITADPGVFYLCDRLSHQGGLDGTVVTPNLTTNLPTAALTRYTSGDGVWAGISVYTAVAGTATTLTCSYTNQAGVAGQISPPTPFGGATNGALWRMVPIPLAGTDTGVRSIENYTLAATIGVVGNFGFTLFKPLLAFSFDSWKGGQNFSLLDGGMTGQIPVIQDGACLFWMQSVIQLLSPGTSLYCSTPFATA